MSKKLDYSKFSPAVLKVLAESDGDDDIQPIKKSPVGAILFAQELREKTDAIIKLNEKIKEEMGAVATEIFETNKDLKEKEKAINDLKMKKAEKVDKLRVLHAQSKERDSELNSLIRQMASLHSNSFRSEKNSGGNNQGQDTMNQLNTDVGKSSGSYEQEIAAMTDDSDLKAKDFNGTEEQNAD